MLGALSFALRWTAGTLAATTALAAPPAATAPAEDEFRDVRVEVVGLDADALLAALRLRLPGTPVARHDLAPPSNGSFVYVRIAREPDGAASLRLITSDGRAFDRSLAVDASDEVRVAASMAVNLIFAAEQRTVAPDREHVPIPPVVTEPPREPEPPPRETSPPPREVEPPPREPPPPRQPAPPRPRWEWSLVTHVGAAIRLGPTDYGVRMTGAGGGLAIEARAPIGASVGLELRGLGRRDEPLTFGRVRVAVSAGYVLRRRRFELPLSLALAVEPWWVVNAVGEPVLFSDGTEAARRPLFGGYVRAAPGLRVERPGKAASALRVGPRIELGGEMLYYGKPVIGGLADATGAPHFRLGGLELALGVEVAVWFGRPARPPAGR